MKKRVFAALMCLCLLLTLLPTTAVAAGGGAIQLGASGIAKGNTVYYGNYAQSDATGATKDPIKWRVLSTTPNGTKTTDEAWSAGDGLLLLSGQNLDVQPYHVENENVTWRRSTLRSWLNGYAAEENKGGDDGVDYTSNNFINTAFDEKESAQILQTKLENAKNPTYDTAGGVATTDRVFALSIAEVNSLDYFADNAARFGANTAYVASKEEMSSEGDGDIWWLRSPGDNNNRAAAVDDVCSVIDSGYTVPSSVVAVRPAFNLGLDAVLFTSAAVGGKSASGMDSGLTAVSTTTPTEWKLTLKDDSRSFTAATTAVNGNVLTVAYSGAATGANEYISAIVKDSSGNVTHYGRLKNTTDTAAASGTVNIDLSGVTMAATDMLYVFSEQYNGGTSDNTKLTDYASNMVEVSLTITVNAPKRYEAEDATLFGCVVADDAAASGGKYVKITDSGQSITFDNVSVSATGNYTVTIRYRASVGEKLNNLCVNGVSQSQMTFAESSTFTDLETAVKLYQGSNEIAIESSRGWIDVDYIEVAPDTGIPAEQFTLPVGETYWFDLSGAGIPGTPNAGNEYGAVSMPDTTLHYVPFTYAGTVNAYSLGASSSGDAAASGNATPSLRSLFVADYAVTNNVLWDDDLNDKSLIFGKDYASGGVNYTLRAPSMGSDYTSDGSDNRGVPANNEWDAVLNGVVDISNWKGMYSLGQDTYYDDSSSRAYRGYFSARDYSYVPSGYRSVCVGFRPVLEVLNPDALTSDGLKAVILDLNGGKLTTAETYTGAAITQMNVVYTGNSFAAPVADGLTRPNGNTGSYFKWLGSDGLLYAPNAAVPSTVTTLTAQWTDPHSHAWSTTVWTTNDTHHWHECEGVPVPCSITENSAKDGYGAHMAGDWVIDTNATASTSGSKHKECTACGYVMETVTIPATGGSYDPTDYYALTFDTNGGSSISTARVSEYATVDLTLSKYIPTREGYEFTGWYSDKALTVKITSIRLTKNTTIYAGWEDKTNPNTGVDNPFTDVKDTDWFFDDVMFVYGNKLMLGTSATTFSPNDTTTRAMVVTILWRMEGSPKVTGSSGFTDVSDGKYYTDAVTWAKQNDIIKGYSNTLFGPNDPVTREQLAAFFYRYAQYKGYDTTISGSISSFKDKDKVSDWAVDAMKWAVGYGVIQGKTGNLLDPQGDATRAQLAAMLHRLIEKTSLWRA